MRISSQGIALIKQFEGFSAYPYQCPAGYRTVGYGHVIGATDQYMYPLDAAEAEAILVADSVLAERAVASLIAIALSQPQFDALVSFTYNMGVAALQRSTLRQVINRGEYGAIEGPWMRWVYAKGRILKGLVARRQAEISLYIS
jgi:lysozyme